MRSGRTTLSTVGTGRGDARGFYAIRRQKKTGPGEGARKLATKLATRDSRLATRYQNSKRAPNRTCRGVVICGPATFCEIGLPKSGFDTPNVVSVQLS